MRWIDFANENRLPITELLNRLEIITTKIPDAIDRTQKLMQTTQINHPVIDQLSDAILKRAEYCIQSIATAKNQRLS